MYYYFSLVDLYTLSISSYVSKNLPVFVDFKYVYIGICCDVSIFPPNFINLAIPIFFVVVARLAKNLLILKEQLSLTDS